jgi:uncharacterized surface protein with fasciclin (FAS1) repeats
MSAPPNIVLVASSNHSLSMFVKALKATDLIDTLSGSSRYTVFAPTNEAFAKISKADWNALLADKASLTKILTYHIVFGKLTAADVLRMNGKTAKTVEGANLNFTISDQLVEINEAKVIKTDIAASNGVIHSIDTVLMPL